MHLSSWRRVALCGLALATFTLAPTAARAQLPVFFDGFLADNGGQPADNFNGFFLWNVTDGSVDLIGGNLPGVDDPALGGRYVDLGGSTGNPGTFATRQPIVFLPGITYNFSFLYNSVDGLANSATASVGTQQFNVSSSSTTFQTFSQDLTFTDLTSANIVFQNLESDTDDSGIGIDRVQILPLAASIAAPEPGTVGLLFAGAVPGMVYLRRRRK